MSAETNAITGAALPSGAILLYLDGDECEMLLTILDVARQDESDEFDSDAGTPTYRERCAEFAERLYDLVGSDDGTGMRVLRD